MKKSNVLLLAAMAMMASCNSDVIEGLSSAPQESDGPATVNFNAYTSRGVTRSGTVGAVTNTLLKSGSTAFGQAGFGVFAYYTNADDYASDVRPNFMFNQQVKWNDTYNLFDYTPVRYWPNEYGQTAQSEDIDKVSFFAYAPYVEVKPATGYLEDAGEGNEEATWGITGTTRNTYTGDPLVKYITSFDMDKSVDLCWGVYNEGASGWATMNGLQTTTNGLPWLNVQHAKSVDQRLNFTFRHATARLNVQVDADVDGGGNATELGTHYGTGGTVADNATKVYVRSVAFTGVAAQGALNLNNTKPFEPLWMNYSGTGWIENGQSVTVYDGLRDGYEGLAAATANNETVTGLNPVVISNEGNTTAGVTHTTVNLFGRSSGATALTDGIFVIPTGERVSITIVYDVETAVPNLPGYLSDGQTHGTSVENKITTDLKVGGQALTFEGGKSYTLRMHLGMNSVKFSAEVSEDWDDGATIDMPRQLTLSISSGASSTTDDGGTVESDGSVTYAADGTPHGPDAGDITVTGEDGNPVTLTEGTDYDITYSGTLSDGSTYGPTTVKPTFPGSYTMILTGKGDYVGTTSTQPFTIEPKALAVSGTSATMNGSDLDAIAATDAATSAALTKGSSGDYQLIYEGVSPTSYGPSTVKPTTPGTYTWTVKGNAQSLYGGAEETGTFTLVPEALSVAMTNGQANPTYVSDGSTPKGPGAGDITVSDEHGNPLTLTEDTDYDITYSGTLGDGTSWGSSTTKPTFPGNYTMTITGKAGSDYDGLSATQPFTLTGEDIAVTGITDGGSLKPSALDAITVKGATSGTTLSAPADYTITYEGVSPTSYGPSTTKPTTGGTYTATVKANAESKYGDAAPKVYTFTLDTSVASGASTGAWTSGGSALSVTKK